MRVLGIDPGVARMGYGLLDGTGGDAAPLEWGVVETPPGALPERLVRIFDDLEALIARTRPQAAAVEQLFFGHNTTTAIAVGQARGVALLALARAGVPVVELAPARVKQAVTGFGKADKRQVQAMVARLLRLTAPPHPDDAADALAIAWAAWGVARGERAVP